MKRSTRRSPLGACERDHCLGWHDELTAALGRLIHSWGFQVEAIGSCTSTAGTGSCGARREW